MAPRPDDLTVLFLESHDGGSHRAFREGLVAHSAHAFRCLTMRPRYWKWRMRAAAARFADLLRDDPEPRPDVILATSLVNLADLRGLVPPPLDRVPLVLYMHENQLTYPLSPLEEFDFHFGFTSILSSLAADLVVFNSAFHRDLFLDAIPAFLNRMPEDAPRGVPERLAARSRVLPVGMDRPPLPEGTVPAWRGGPCDAEAGPPWPRGSRPVILWNHRWEFDKRPEWFAAAVGRLLDRGLDFEVILAGDSRHRDAVFAPLIDRLQDRCIHHGHADRERYQELLQRSDVVVSCAAQEYFGIAVAEAIHAGCYPVLPREQVYPSLYGSRCRGRHLYRDEDDLVDLLAALIGGRCGHVCSLQQDTDPWCWPTLAARYDALLREAAALPPKGIT